MKNLYCSLFGHDYKVSKTVTYHVKEYKCKHCKSEMTIDGNGNFIPLTPKFKEINSVLHRVHLKRLEKSQKLFMLDY
ncbi:MAG: hypothetical protein CMC76_00300 [Flavobacteriaceae bacterium]|uniref:hypothetical protein n=1 Tax=Winogradskyella sp. SYSU M77433 TaxID=3042722 RepID=UPI000C41AE1A|nr:hypothetical protein [Winogradskyella sp. SYSU M77433]MAX69534.1 hypothetical protein [Flavobacteriaceae bacterium]MDH7913550.1 hypothetical protein [Winogradskyella sp. SYSU M77433]|tara:strand:+ start:260 stop:490 length:231 start_codon:yes stop_codon:yes gene_type:complete